MKINPPKSRRLYCLRARSVPNARQTLLWSTMITGLPTTGEADVSREVELGSITSGVTSMNVTTNYFDSCSESGQGWSTRPPLSRSRFHCTSDSIVAPHAGLLTMAPTSIGLFSSALRSLLQHQISSRDCICSNRRRTSCLLWSWNRLSLISRARSAERCNVPNRASAQMVTGFQCSEMK